MINWKALAAATAMLLLGGCTSFRTLEKTTTVGPGETVFVLGVAPENYRVKVFPGVVKDGKFREDTLGLAAIFSAPENGYIVGKAKRGATLAITAIVSVKEQTDIIGTVFLPCAGLKTMVFVVPDEPVVYLGDVHYLSANQRIGIRYTSDLDSAATHLAKTYPNLPAKPVQAAYELLPTSLSCSQTVTIPIYR